MIQQRIAALRALLQDAEADACIVPTGDFHGSEYLAEHFKAREYLSGFTGSAGVLAVTLDEAALFTDGRYFVQAKEQLAGSGIDLMPVGEPGCPTLAEYLLSRVPALGAVAFDGRVMAARTALKLHDALREKNIRLLAGRDLAGEIWPDRPNLPKNAAFLLDEAYAGESAAAKIARVREVMRERGATVHIMADLADVAWTFNVRGADIAYTPLALAFAAIEGDGAVLFMDADKAKGDLRAALAGMGVSLRPYEDLPAYCRASLQGKTVLLDPDTISFSLYLLCASHAKAVVEEKNPAARMKAVKNPIEIENIREAHVRDGVALFRFMRYLKEEAASGALTERSAQEKIDALRREAGAIMPSFETISAFGPHAAIVHYAVTAASDARIAPPGLLLVDSGGQYVLGTTDVTRTFAVGDVPEAQKSVCSIVLSAMLSLADARFPYGCTGAHLDALARGKLWAYGLDYRHGTGHGVGYFSCVHEGPNGFRYNAGPAAAVLEPGMVTSDEPGFYREGEFGVRTENLLLCVEDSSGEYGRFLRFEHLTLAPIDLDALDLALLGDTDRQRLNAYHRLVYEALAPHLTPEERLALLFYTRAVPV